LLIGVPLADMPALAVSGLLDQPADTSQPCDQQLREHAPQAPNTAQMMTDTASIGEGASDRQPSNNQVGVTAQVQ
jgi:hypothetical protein